LKTGEDNTLDSIAILHRSHFRRLTIDLAQVLKARHGSKVHLVCQRRDDAAYYEKMGADNIFDSITTGGNVLLDEYPSDLNEDAVFARARHLEKAYGITLNDLILQNRHHGRGFAPGGFYHPRSHHSEKVDYAQTLHAYDDVLTFWESFLRDKKITLLLNSVTEAFPVANTMGIPVFSLTEARYKNYWFWSLDRYFRNAGIEREFSRLDAAISTDALDAPLAASLQNRAKIMEMANVSSLVKSVVQMAKKQLIWRLIGHTRGKDYFFGSEIKFRYHIWRDINRLTRMKLPTLDDLGDKPFVFFPLHTEPEQALQALSPEFLHQHAAIVSIARDLPAGVILVVKEHMTAVGRRSENFYDQLRDFRNVVLMDPLEFGLDVVRKANALITISGTAGTEAAVLGKPVITFGRHNNYDFLPHVRVVTREEDLRGYLDEALNGGIDLEKAKLDGARYFQAVQNLAFDFKGLDLFKPDIIEDWMAEAACDNLLRSLQEFDLDNREHVN
jgi:hypothetical protein